MPFDSSFDDLYKLGIKATCEELNSYCERVDEQIFQGSILDRILNQIAKAVVIVADMTGRNPNVFFEVGYAKAFDKRIILLTSSVEDIPFDLKHYSHVIYDSSIIKLKDSLKTHLQYYFANPDKTQSEMTAGVNLYVYGVKLLEGGITRIEVPDKYHSVLLTVENVSGVALEPNALQITARTDDHWAFGRHEGKKYVLDQKNNERWMLFNDTPIFHGAEHTYELCHVARVEKGNKVVELSVFTRSGRGRYTLEIIPNAANKGN
jgi:hypothetical protein